MAATWRFSLFTFSHYNLGHHQWRTNILAFTTVESWSVPCQFCWLASYSGCYKAEIYSLWPKPWPVLVQLSRKYCSILDNGYTSYSIKLLGWIRTSCSVAFHLEKSVNTINACLFFFPVFSLFFAKYHRLRQNSFSKTNSPQKISFFVSYCPTVEFTLESCIWTKFPKWSVWPKFVKLPSGLHWLRSKQSLQRKTFNINIILWAFLFLIPREILCG